MYIFDVAFEGKRNVCTWKGQRKIVFKSKLREEHSKMEHAISQRI
jgi:hypothetical protein